VKSDLIEFIGNARRRRSETFRKQAYIFMVCLMLSVFIWALVRLSRDYYHSIEYHLQYTHVPPNLRLMACSDTTLNLRIKLQGFEFFSEQFIVRQYRVFEVSLQNARIRYSGNQARGYLLTNRIGREIIAQYNFPNDVFYVMPDTLFFDFEKQQTLNKIPRKEAGTVRIEVAGKDTILRRTDTISYQEKQRNVEIKSR
jgi:hypothetical protein